MSRDKIKLLIWMNMPSHHQSDFFAALRNNGVDLVVLYYGNVEVSRRKLGWESSVYLPEGEFLVAKDIGVLGEIADWKERIHVLPGYGTSFLRKLVRFVVSNEVSWMHWSEPAHPGIKWFLSYPIKRWYATKVNKSAILALAIGANAANDFVRWGINRKKIELLTYSINEVRVGDPMPEIRKFSSRFNKVFLFLGELCWRKGTDVLISAFSEIAKAVPDAGLLLVGCDSSRGKYMENIIDLGLKDKVNIFDAVPAGSVGSVIDLCSVLVLPSRFDGWGMVVNEAASLAKGIIATESVGAAHHLIKNGENGFVVKPGSSASLCQAISHYAEDEGLSAIHGRRSRELFLEYTPTENAKKLKKLLEAQL